MYDLVTNETGEIALRDSKVHTLTYEDPNAIIAPTLANHLETLHLQETETNRQAWRKQVWSGQAFSRTRNSK